MKLLLPLIVLVLGGLTTGYAQAIKGKVTNKNNEPIPFVNIYIKTLERGTTTDANGSYFLTLQPGEYEVIYSVLGYQAQRVMVEISDKDFIQHVQLLDDQINLEAAEVKASKKSPAFEIIKKVIDRKDRYFRQAKSYQCEVYLKATEQLEDKTPPKKVKKAPPVTVGLEGTPVDPFEGGVSTEDKKVPKINLVEAQLTLHFQAPKNYKEERTAYQSYGDISGLFLPRLSEDQFNIYQNSIFLRGIAETPIVSPLSTTAILSYKYKLEEEKIENGRVVYKIKVSPRKFGNSTINGYLYINDSLWNVNRLELSFPKGALKIYDHFQINQYFSGTEDGRDWRVYKQQFIYEEKKGRYKAFKGITTMQQSDWKWDVQYPPKFFGNEVAITTREAYERDTSYWQDLRPEALSQDEEQMVRYRDSIQAVITSKPYLDSVDAAFNKVKFGELIYHGVEFRNHERKEHVYISPITGLIEFELVGGWRMGLPYSSYFKRWKDDRYIYLSGGASIGLRNADIQGYGNARYRYDPLHLGFLDLRGGRSFASINPNDAYLNQLKTSNFILNDRIGIGHTRELFNGFYASFIMDLRDRKSLQGFDTKTFINRAIDDDSAPVDFEDYQAFITELKLSYTPKQRYMREPTRKIVLGSNFPTFGIVHRKGWSRILGSDINFDYVEALVSQDIVLGIYGQSKYTARIGKFVNTKDLRYVDLLRFRQSDPYLFSDPKTSFQLLDTSLVATDLYIEAHHIHHFNGALINNIPLIKHLRLNVVAGAGFLWVKEDDYRHEEVFAGVERIFKFGARRRLRIGCFGVVASSNKTGINTGFKISFDIIDIWKKDWSY